jgi:hypothetical protein
MPQVEIGNGLLVSLLGLAGSALAYFIARDIKKKDAQDELRHQADVAVERRLTALEEAKKGNDEGHRDLWDEVSFLREKSEANASAIDRHLAVCDERSKNGVHK